MNLNTNNWKSFYLNKLFYIKPGNYHYSYEYEAGNTPYISASNSNNGIQKYINLKPDFEGNCIVTGKIGCTAFYQSESFCATSDVNILIPKNFKLNKKIGMFISTIINFSENYKWNYGRQCRVGDSKKIEIKLPILYKNNNIVLDNKFIFSDNGYIPDFDFIQNYINNLNYKQITTSNKINTSNSFNSFFETSKWGIFKLYKLFNQIYKAKAYAKNEMLLVNFFDKKSINFITRTDKNNGCDCFVNKEELLGIEPKNAITIGDTTCTIYYQDEEFVAGDHIVVCRADWLNKYTGLFIKTILDQENFRYNYGRAFKKELIKKTSIKLPIDEKDVPDWEKIEKFIQLLPYGDRI